MPSSSKVLRGLHVQGRKIYYPRLQEEPPLPPSGRTDTVLPPTAISANKQASQAVEILEKARAEAAELRREILAEAAAEADRLQAQAQQEGFQAGLRQGEREAEKSRAEARQILKEAWAERREIIAAAEPEIIRLALNIAEKILNYEVSMNERTILHLIARGLNVLPAGQKVCIRVHPRDEKACRENLSQLQALLKEGVLLEITTDRQLPPGSCRLESAEAEVEIILQRELQILGKKLLALAVSSAGSSQEPSLQTAPAEETPEAHN
ncbi:MAG: hypothetical protein GX334_08960 [Firmicutes bacterium]|nr:hypothetical protein [Bacillota bacterium]